MAGIKVMIVEDEVITAVDLKKDLEGMGYETCPLATSGEKALSVLEAEHPDVVLMDIKLRGEMDGIKTAGEIRSRFGIPIIFISGYPPWIYREDSQVNEFRDYLVKPLEIGKVKETIDSVLQK